MVNTNKVFDDKCFVTVTPENGTNVEFAAYTKDITIDGGDTGVEVFNTNAGQTVKRNRPEMFEVSFDDVIPLNLDFAALKEGQTSGVNTITCGGLSAGVGGRTQRFRIAMLWPGFSSGVLTSATGGMVSGSYARRIVLKDGYYNNYNESWKDQMLNGSAKFQFAYMDETGSGNVLRQVCTGGNSFSALTAYTGTNFG